MPPPPSSVLRRRRPVPNNTSDQFFSTAEQSYNIPTLALLYMCRYTNLFYYSITCVRLLLFTVFFRIMRCLFRTADSSRCWAHLQNFWVSQIRPPHPFPHLYLSFPSSSPTLLDPSLLLEVAPLNIASRSVGAL